MQRLLADQQLQVYFVDLTYLTSFAVMSRKPEGEEHRVPVAVALLDKEEKVQLLKVRCTMKCTSTTNVPVKHVIKATGCAGQGGDGAAAEGEKQHEFEKYY